jgi:hypothetical protein
MAIDDVSLMVRINQIKEDDPLTSESVRDVAIRAVVSTAFPLVGAFVTELLAETADRRWKERLYELFTDFAERVARLSSQIENPNYFKSEEAQALFLEAIDQQKTNRFEEKRKMLAQGLANSGTSTHIKDQSK